MDQQAMIGKLEKEIAELEQGRDQFVGQANQTIAHYNGRIEAKREVVAMLREPEAEPAVEDEAAEPVPAVEEKQFG